MIGKLKGRVDAVLDDSLILDVQGVGYEVFGSSKLLGQYRGGEEGVELWIDTLVREDLIRLNGFSSQQERQWFRLLQSVQGVGAKVALAILGTLPIGDLASAIALQDKAMVARAPGVGPKVAQRIVAELKDKAPAMSGDATGTIGLQQELGEGVAASAVVDAVSALTNLGYSAQQASGAVAQAVKDAGEDAPAATLIRLGLKALSS
ncbi:Holliday junction branch migration protein RuvA [Ahrensia marina]|uniref:Holliday junction branch migration protein RuvA n=1 Tax=Ahrensia marina TaxID=1514904 RepID=UPI0035CEB4A0